MLLLCIYSIVSLSWISFYSETCETRTPLGQAKSVPNSDVSSFQGAICPKSNSLGLDEVFLFHNSVAIHMFHSISFSFTLLLFCFHCFDFYVCHCVTRSTRPCRSSLRRNTIGDTRVHCSLTAAVWPWAHCTGSLTIYGRLRHGLPLVGRKNTERAMSIQ
jgi:hypothetical protein